jgi:WD40 repeat protein
MIWDTATRKSVATFANSLPGSFGVTFSPDGERLATAGADGKVRLWDAASGQQLFDLKGHKADAFSVDFSSDAKRLVSAGWDGASRSGTRATVLSVLRNKLVRRDTPRAAAVTGAVVPEQWP